MFSRLSDRLSVALAGQGIVRLSDFVSREDRASGRLVQILTAETRELRLPIHAVYYRNQSLASRIRCFLDFLREKISLSICVKTHFLVILKPK